MISLLEEEEEEENKDREMSVSEPEPESESVSVSVSESVSEPEPESVSEPEPVVRRLTYDDLFAEPFTDAMSEMNEDVYDLSEMTDEDFAALMTWLYAAGWGFATETRRTIDLDPTANLPPRIWAGRCTDPEPAPSKPPKKSMVIPRFCREGETCPHKETTCHYTHGNTIPCVNEPCKYDKTCSGSDKRAMCIRMHASEGQVWRPGMVVTRLAS